MNNFATVLRISYLHLRVPGRWLLGYSNLYSFIFIFTFFVQSDLFRYLDKGLQIRLVLEALSVVTRLCVREMEIIIGVELHFYVSVR